MQDYALHRLQTSHYVVRHQIFTSATSPGKLHSQAAHPLVGSLSMSDRPYFIADGGYRSSVVGMVQELRSRNQHKNIPTQAGRHWHSDLAARVRWMWSPTSMSSERNDVHDAQFRANGSNVQATADFVSQLFWSRLVRPLFRSNIKLEQASAPQRCTIYATTSRLCTLSTDFMSRSEGKSGANMEWDGEHDGLGTPAFVCLCRRTLYGRWDLQCLPFV